MIEKIRRTLIIKNTIIITIILLIGFAASYVAYRHNGIRLLKDSLQDYLTEETWEAEELIKKGHTEPEVHTINSNVSSFHNFTYWIINNEIIRAERPADQHIAEQLEKRLLTKTYKTGKIYHENMKSNRKKWYFMLIQQNISPDISPNGKVFVLANYTPVRQNTKTYIRIALIATMIMIILAYLIGSFFATRSMKYIEKSYQLQKQFVSDAAHELRTPLAILFSYTELLEYTKKKKEIISDIKAEIQQMNNLVDKLLSIARYENSTNIIKKEVFLINKLTLSVLKPINKLFPDHTFSLIQPDKKIKIEADPVMIKQLLNILLDNAAKYSPENRNITIKLENSGNALKITIKDHGIGIKKEDLPHIFDRFWRAEESRHQKGLGLGLSLAREIVRLHHGTINVESTPNHGTTFEIILPIK